MTSSRDVLDCFVVRSETARRLFDNWTTDPSKRDVVPVVMAHVTAVPYAATVAQLIEVCRETEHALGNARRSVGESVEPIRDWHPDFAFTHVMHFVTERLGEVPTYQRFREFCGADPDGQRMLYVPAKRAIEEAAQRGYDVRAAREAMRWRIGNAYYSFIREVHVLAVLREAGVLLQIHPLADALFRVDAWIDDIVLALYVGNARYRRGEDGRKPTAHSLLADSIPAFRFHSLELPTQHSYGDVHLAGPESLDAAIARLRGLLPT